MTGQDRQRAGVSASISKQPMIAEPFPQRPSQRGAALSVRPPQPSHPGPSRSRGSAAPSKLPPRGGGSLQQHPPGSHQCSQPWCQLPESCSSPSPAPTGQSCSLPGLLGTDAHGRRGAEEGPWQGSRAGVPQPGKASTGGSVPASLSRKPRWLPGRRAEPCQAAPAAATAARQL